MIALRIYSDIKQYFYLKYLVWFKLEKKTPYNIFFTNDTFVWNMPELRKIQKSLDGKALDDWYKKQHQELKLYRICQLRVKVPDLRIGQWICNALPADKDLFYIEDGELERILEKFINTTYNYSEGLCFKINGGKIMNIVELASKYTKLRSCGDYLIGICPIKKCGVQGFTISPERNIFYCFSCKTAGGPQDLYVDKSIDWE